MAMHDLPTLRENRHPLSFTANGSHATAVVPQDAGSNWELYGILDTLHTLDTRNREAVLATTVQVLGSSYRSPGARMLLTRDGRRFGSVVSPALETELAKEAWWFTEAGAPVTRKYGASLVLIERTDTRELSQLIEYLEAHRTSRKPAVIATIIAAHHTSAVRVGDRLLLDDSWARCGALTGSPLESQVLTHASAALREKKSRLVRLGQVDLFVEWIGPPPALAIFGQGRDTAPLARFARQLGWDVVVSESGWSNDPLAGLNIAHDSAVVIMSHNDAFDTYLLRRILPLRPSYLGLLGSKKRSEQLFAKIGTSPGPNVHAPAGLDLGGDSPELVAFSIIAEIQAKLNHRSGGMLKRRAATIHAPILEKGLPREVAEPEAVSHAHPG